MNAPERPIRPIRPGRDRPTQPRLLRELATIEAMTQIYCAHHHGASKPCQDCQALIDYAAKRLAVCTFGDDKPVCAKCQIHCYGRVMREKVREVMRYAGPRMIWHHPWLALMHVLDKRYKAPPRPGATADPSAPRLPSGPRLDLDTSPDSGHRPTLTPDNVGGSGVGASRSG